MISTLKNQLKNNKSHLVEQALATCAASFSRLSFFLIVLINTQFLSPKDFGVFSIILLIVNIINAMVSCGGDMWLNRFTRHHHSHTKRAPLISRFYLQMSVGVAAIIASIVLALSFLDINTFNEYRLTILYAVTWAISGGLIETILAILRTMSGIRCFFVIRDIVMPALLISGIFIFKINTACTFFLFASLIALSVLIILSTYIFNNQKLCLPKSSLLTWKRIGTGLIGYTSKLILNNFSSRMSNGFDSLMLSYYLSMDLVGKYRLAVQFSNAFLVIQHFIFLALPWHMRVTHCARGTDGAKVVQSRNDLLIYTALLALIILLIITKPSLNLFAKDYADLSTTICAFLLIRFSEVLWGPQHEILISNNKVLQDTSANVIGLLFGVISFFISIQFYDFVLSGIVSAGLNSFCTQLIRYIILKTQVYKSNNSKNSNSYLPWLPFLLIITGLSYAAL